MKALATQEDILSAPYAGYDKTKALKNIVIWGSDLNYVIPLLEPLCTPQSGNLLLKCDEARGNKDSAFGKIDYILENFTIDKNTNFMINAHGCSNEQKKHIIDLDNCAIVTGDVIKHIQHNNSEAKNFFLTSCHSGAANKGVCQINCVNRRGWKIG